MKTRLLLLLLPILLHAPWAHAAPDAPKPPNIVFIFADDLGYGDLGCYGQKLIQTPNIDRLAGQGMKFTQFYAGSTVCAPSRSVLMTGLHMGHTRVRGNAREHERQRLHLGDVTVAEVLKEAGYATALVGKWGLGLPGDDGVPNRQGFDHFFGFLSQYRAHQHYPDYVWRNDKKVPVPNVVIPVGKEGSGYPVKNAPAGPIQLYDLVNDIDEQIDVAQKHPALVSRLAGIMRSAHVPNEHWKIPGFSQ